MTQDLISFNKRAMTDASSDSTCVFTEEIFLTPVFLVVSHAFLCRSRFLWGFTAYKIVLPVSNIAIAVVIDSLTSNTNAILLVLFDANNQSNQVPVPVKEHWRIPEHHEARTQTHEQYLNNIKSVWTEKDVRTSFLKSRHLTIIVVQQMGLGFSKLAPARITF